MSFYIFKKKSHTTDSERLQSSDSSPIISFCHEWIINRSWAAKRNQKWVSFRVASLVNYGSWTMSFPSKILWAFSSLEHVHWRGFRWTARQEEIALCIILLATGHENWHLQLCGEVRRNSCHLLQSLVQGRSKSELDLASCFCVERRRVRPVAVRQPEKQVVVCAGRSHTCLMVQEGSTGCKVQPGCRTASAVWFWCQQSERPSLKTEILTTGRDFDFLWISCFFFSFSSFAVSHFQCMIIFTLAVPPLCL